MFTKFGFYGGAIRKQDMFETDIRRFALALGFLPAGAPLPHQSGADLALSADSRATSSLDLAETFDLIGADLDEG